MMSQNNLKEIKKIRLEKIDFLKRKSIQPYAYKYNVENSINEIKRNPEKYLEITTSIAGRIISLRKMGKSCFLNIQDLDNKIHHVLLNNAENIH